MAEEESECEVVFHVDESPTTTLRSRIFGHQGVIIPLKEGLIAKKCRILRELQFYLDYAGWIHDVIPADLVPSVAAIADELSTVGPNEVKVQIRRNGSVPNMKNPPYLLLKDIVDGFRRPAVLDIKLGTRTWAFGADSVKVERMKGKCRDCPTAELRFRVRAAMWYSNQPEKWPVDDGVNYVTRELGNTWTEEELFVFLKDFFHFRKQLPFFVEKLENLRSAVCKLRSEHNARMYSSSVLLVYDEDDPDKKECRILDFAKTYLHVDEVAEQFHEKMEDCEDGVVPAITNLLRLLRRMNGLCAWCSGTNLGTLTDRANVPSPLLDVE